MPAFGARSRKAPGVAAACSVRWLLGRERQQGFDQFQIQVQQDAAMEQDELAFPALGVAGELTPAPGEVRVTLDGNRFAEES